MRRVALQRAFPSGLLRATATRPQKPLPWRRPSSVAASSVSTVSAGHPTSAVSTRHADPTAVSTNMLEEERQLEVLWADHTSYYDWTWLRVNCPSFVHESGHRTVFPGDVDPELKPVEVRECLRGGLHTSRLFAVQNLWLHEQLKPDATAAASRNFVVSHEHPITEKPEPV